MASGGTERSGNTTWKLTALLLTTLSSTLSPLPPAQMSSIQLLLPSLLTSRATGAAIGSVIVRPILKASHVYPPGLSTPEEEHFEVQFSEAIKTLTNELLQHRPPLAPQRTNLASEERQPPRAQVFGGFTVRGRGMTSCTLKYPKILAAIHALAMLRPGAAKHEPYLSASLNEYSALPMHTDRSNYGNSWTISFGDYSGGGRLWIESPTGTRVPPCCNHEWEKKFRGEFVDTNMCWTKFDARIFHAVEPVKSGRRMSLTCLPQLVGKRSLTPSCLTSWIMGSTLLLSLASLEARQWKMPLRV